MKLDLAFESRFVLPYKLCKMIFDDANFAKAFPESRVLCREDSFLALLYRLNKGCEFSTVSDVFGASPDTHSRTFGKYLDACLVFFKKTINIPSKLECEKMKKVLSRNGFPNPQAVFIGMFNFLFTSRQKKKFLYQATASTLEFIQQTQVGTRRNQAVLRNMLFGCVLLWLENSRQIEKKTQSFVVIDRLTCRFVYAWCDYFQSNKTIQLAQKKKFWIPAWPFLRE